MQEKTQIVRFVGEKTESVDMVTLAEFEPPLHIRPRRINIAYSTLCTIADMDPNGLMESAFDYIRGYAQRVHLRIEFLDMPTVFSEQAVRLFSHYSEAHKIGIEYSFHAT